jgi:molybdopterin synthase catalytic subunit
MRVRVVAFASAAEALDSSSLEVEIADGSRLADLQRRLEADRPELGALWPRWAIAVGGELAGPEAPLADGVEVALLPPVSGGAPHTRLVDGPIDVAALEAEAHDPRRGAVLLFVGRVRDHYGTRRVSGLTYEAYRPMAEAALERIADELASAAPGLDVRIVHRLGEVDVGEASVAIAAASPHRAAAYEASRRALERLKREVPIWKRERYADGGATWREEEPLAPSARTADDSPTSSAAPTDPPRDSTPRSRPAG